MTELIPMDEMGVFATKKNVVMVDSRWVAKAFRKRHDNVVRDIDKMISPESGLSHEFNLLNFEEISYKDTRGRDQRAYGLTKDGFTVLVMGYTGKKAMAFKEAYINRFNQMEEQLKSLIAARVQFPLLMEHIKTIKGDDAKPYHYSNEADMLNRIVLGVSAKQFREKYRIPKGESIRPYLRADQIAMLDYLQTMDMGLVMAVQDYQQRKMYLQAAAVNAIGKYGTTRDSIAIATEEGKEHGVL